MEGEAAAKEKSPDPGPFVKSFMFLLMIADAHSRP
jgi:hypothetical protein